MGTALAHNDLIHIMMERGLIGILARVMLLVGLAMQLPHIAMALLVIVIASSTLSNGFLQTPMAASHAMLAISVALHGVRRQQTLAMEADEQQVTMH